MARKNAAAKAKTEETEPEVIVTAGEDLSETELNDELEGLIAEIEGEGAPTEASDEDLEAVAAEASVAEAKAEAYADQENPDGAPIEPKSKKGRSKKVTVIGPAKTPGARLTHGFGEKDVLKVALLVKGDKATPGQLDTVIKMVDGLAKKVAEKAVNMLRNRTNADKLNRYTAIGLNHLRVTGTTTSAELIARFEEVGYKPGTARSQGNQLMQLFPALGVAERSKNVLTINQNSLLAADYA